MIEDIARRVLHKHSAATYTILYLTFIYSDTYTILHHVPSTRENMLK